MTFTATGFDGSMSEGTWSLQQRNVGVSAVVEQPTHLALTGVAGTRALSVSAGTCAAWGVRGTETNPTSLTCAANGGVIGRWDLVCARYNWGTNTVVLEAVTGAASIDAALAALTITPGTVAQQPLWAVLVAPGATSLIGATMTDLRCFTESGVAAAYPPVDPRYGNRWRNTTTGEIKSWDGTAWVRTDADSDWITQAVTGAGVTGNIYRRKVGNIVWINIQATTSASGGSTRPLGVMPAGWRPSTELHDDGYGGFGVPCVMVIQPDGTLYAQGSGLTTAGVTITNNLVIPV